MLGCVVFSAQRRRQGRGHGDLDAWGALQRALCDVMGSALRIEKVPTFTSAQTATSGTAIVFRVPFDGHMLTAAELARELCACFGAEPAAGNRRALCRGRLARHRPRELFLTAGTAAGGARALWHAPAPGQLHPSFAPLQESSCHSMPG